MPATGHVLAGVPDDEGQISAYPQRSGTSMGKRMQQDSPPL